jgi:hypothetical protein
MKSDVTKAFPEAEPGVSAFLYTYGTNLVSYDSNDGY